MYLRYSNCCFCSTSLAAIWLFWLLMIVNVQQNRLNGDSCLGAMLYAPAQQQQQQQNIQMLQTFRDTVQRHVQQQQQQQQLEIEKSRSKQLFKIDAKEFGNMEKRTNRTNSVTERTTGTERQVVGDMLPEVMGTIEERVVPINLDEIKPYRLYAVIADGVDAVDAMATDVVNESDDNTANRNNNTNNANNANKATKPNKTNLNGSHSNVNEAMKMSNNSQYNDTKSLNDTKTTAHVIRTRTPKIAAMKMKTIKTIVKEPAASIETSTSAANSSTKVTPATLVDFIFNTTITSPPLTTTITTTTTPTTAESKSKRLLAKNLKHSKNLINTEHLAYNFDTNMAVLFASESVMDQSNNNDNANNVEFNLNNNVTANNTNKNNNDNFLVNELNEKSKFQNTVKENNHIESNYNTNKFNNLQHHSILSSVDDNDDDAATIVSSSVTGVTIDSVQLEAVQGINEDNSSNRSNNKNTNNNNNNNRPKQNKIKNKNIPLDKTNKAQHTNERRHIVPEKLQYTKEIVIKQGKLMGITRNFHTSAGLRDVDQYLGLPYAEAPVGSRRFMPPGAPLPWSGLKIARHLPPVCPQQLPDLTAQGSVKMSRGRYKQLTRLLPYLKTESEDCLYLNVYVPRVDGIFETSYGMDIAAKRLPVLVFVHGESFEWNSGNPYDGSVLASYGQVIVVTINYRLGVMGFLKPSIDANTVANFGLLDQIAALHWIKENIASFGGDKDSVTLMGHSTGAACVNYLMISPVASGLFHRAILMSGSAMSDWAVSNHSLQLTMQIAHTLNCPLNDDNEEMLSCLRQKRYQDILKIPMSFSQFSTSLGPIVDGHVIPNQPYKVMGQYTEHFSRYDLLFGVTESESYHMLGALALDEGLHENERDNLLRFYMQTRFDVRPDLALAATIKKYEDMYNNPSKGTNLEHRDVVLDILSDARVVGPLMQTGLFHSDINRHTFMYVFGHNSATGPYASLPHSITGEELAFIFGAPLAPAGPFPSNSYGAQEKLLSEAVMTYWTNFAKTGNPKAPWKGNFINLHALEWDRYDLDWPEFNKRTQVYMNIGIPPSVGYKYRQIYMNFWNKGLPDELNQIANIQRQPYLHTTIYDRNDEGGGAIASQLPRGVTATIHSTYPGQQQHRGNSEVITGHMSQFGTRDNGAEDPVRTLKLLLQEPWKLNGGDSNEEGGGIGSSNTNAGGVGGIETFAENMYNAPPTFGVTKHADDEKLYAMTTTGLVASMGGMTGIVGEGGGGGGSGMVRTNGLGGLGSLGIGTGTLMTGGNAIYGVPSADVAEDNNGGGGGESFGGVGAGSGSSGNKEEVAKSETTLQLLIGLIAIFIVLNIIIYSTFLIQKRKKANTMQRKLGGILSYDGGTTDDEFKRSKQNDGDESYILDIVRKSNTYEAVKTDRSPINGFKMTRQLSTSTVDTHTKVCAWMSAAANVAAAEAKACAGGEGDSSKGGSKKSSSPTFSSLRSSSAGGSFKQPKAPVVIGQKVSVAIDATPQARSGSVLEQEPIEAHKLKINGRNIIICQEVEVMDQELLTPQNSLDSSRYTLMRQHSAATEACEFELPQEGQLPQHAHSHSDPVDMQHYYSCLCEDNEKVTSFRDDEMDINVTSRDSDDYDDSKTAIQLTPAQQLEVIKSRNYPKVLPTTKLNKNTDTNFQTCITTNDSPPMTIDLRTTNKRNSLPPNSFLPHFGIGAAGTICAGSGGRYAPLPPPRTISTLGRKPSQRRNSNNITTSPLRLANDCTKEEDEEPPTITQNTLIVGPIVPQQKPKVMGSDSLNVNYSTLKRRNEPNTNTKVPFNKVESSETEEMTNTNTTKTTAMHNICGMPSLMQNPKPFTLNAGLIGVTTFLSSGVTAGLQSFESQPISKSFGLSDKLMQQQQVDPCQQQQQITHHTERVYAVQEPVITIPATTTTTTTTNKAPCLISPNTMNLTGHQNSSMGHNILIDSKNNNKFVATSPNGITDIYAQPNKSAIKAKSRMPNEQSKITETTPTTTTKITDKTIAEQSSMKSTSSFASTFPRLPDYTHSDLTTKLNLPTEITEASAITTNSSGFDKQVAGRTIDERHMTEVLTNASIQEQSQQKPPQQGELRSMINTNSIATKPTNTTILPATNGPAVSEMLLASTSASTTAQITTSTQTRTPMPTATPSIANAIAAQLAQTKPLKASLALITSQATKEISTMQNESKVDDSDGIKSMNTRDSCLSSASACSTDSRVSSAYSNSSTESTTATDASSNASSWSSSSSSSTGTVRTELKQKTNNNKSKPTQV